MAELMGTGLKACPLHSAGDQTGDRSRSQGSAGRIETQENLPIQTVWGPFLLNIVGQSLHERSGKGEMEQVLVFALAKTDSLISPVDIVQTQTGDFTRTHPQSRGHEKNRKVPFSPTLLTVDTVE